MPGIDEILAWAQQQGRSAVHLGMEGTIVAGTYNPTDGTVQVVVGETLANFDDPDQLPMAITAQLGTMMLGLRGGPQGGERAIIMPTRGGWRCWLEDNFDDAPGVPAGELWFTHYKMGTVGAGNTPVPDTGFKVTNDGPTAGDGLGGAHVGEQGAHTTLDTNSGHQVELNDTAKTVTMKSAGGASTVINDVAETIVTEAIGGNLKTIWDAAGNAISHVVVPSNGILALGDLAANLDSTKAAINAQIVNSTAVGGLAGNINTAILTNLQSYITALTTSLTAGGLPNPHAFSSSMVALIIGSWLTKIANTTGSSFVRIAS